MNDLEKMDALRSRMNVTYSQAKEALDICGGDLASALVYLERQGFPYSDKAADVENEAEKEPIWDKEKADNLIRGMVDQVKDFVRQGNVTKVRLISGEKTLIEIPATVGVLGVGVMLFSPVLAAVAAIGAASAFVKEMVFEVEKSDGTIQRHELKLPRFGGGDCCDDECCDDECCDDECCDDECCDDECCDDDCCDDGSGGDAKAGEGEEKA